MIRFMKHYVTDGKTKARVYYCGNHRIGGVPCVTLYAKDYDDHLGVIFGDRYENRTEIMTDYFEKGLVRSPATDPLYSAAMSRCRQGE
jgi:hypothetical protein